MNTGTTLTRATISQAVTVLSQEHREGIYIERYRTYLSEKNNGRDALPFRIIADLWAEAAGISADRQVQLQTLAQLFFSK